MSENKPLIIYTMIIWLGLLFFAYLASSAGDKSGLNFIKTNIDLLKILMFITMVGAVIYDILRNNSKKEVGKK